ncbi:MAG: hypothetical protein K8T10_18975 [Candidatus Eremiobacteraeota bacterium]|nr:hypothetical protein [Candidatus Eremiobacteraeota bacterium]
MKISSALKIKAITVPIYKIGVGKEERIKIALVQIGISKNLTRSELARNILKIIKSAFEVDPTLHRIDIYGSDRPDTKTAKGEVLFSISALHTDIHRIDPHKSSSGNLNTFGLFYISEKIKDPLLSWRQVAMKRIHRILLMKEKTRKKKSKPGKGENTPDKKSKY